MAMDSTQRMNVPGTCDKNWGWRFNWQQLSEAQKLEITLAISSSGRRMSDHYLPIDTSLC